MKTELKNWPVSATKAEIHKIYYKLPIRIINRAIQYAIDIDNRRRNIKHSLNCKILNSRHIEIIKQELGNAPGYKEVEF